MNPSTEQDYQRIIRQQAQTLRQQQLRIAELEQRVAQLTARVEELSAQVARLSKNSSTSSKPPSSDIVKPPKPPGRHDAVAMPQRRQHRHRRARHVQPRAGPVGGDPQGRVPPLPRRAQIP